MYISNQGIEIAKLIRKELNFFYGGPRKGVPAVVVEEKFAGIAREVDEQREEGWTKEEIASFWKLREFTNCICWSPEDHIKKEMGEANPITKYWGCQGRVERGILKILG